VVEAELVAEPAVGVMRAVLDGQAPQDADLHHAEGVLRLLGLPAKEAAEIARRALPSVSSSRPG
jgi:hypothetical protein